MSPRRVNEGRRGCGRQRKLYATLCGRAALVLGMAARALAWGSDGGTNTTLSFEPGSEAHTRPVGIIIVALGRSGSSMVGEFFKSNEDVLYWYEPCRREGGVSKKGPECSKFASRLVQCEFTVRDTKWLWHDLGAVRSGSPQLRPLLDASNDQEIAEAHNEILQACWKSRAAVVKTIRLQDSLGDAGSQTSAPLEHQPLFLHLVRDPRAVVRSQMVNFEGVKANAGGSHPIRAGEKGARVCDMYRSQMTAGAKIDTNRYLMVRYEDIVTSPNLAVELIYVWAGLRPVPENVLQWIRESTTVPACDGPNGRRRLSQAGRAGFGYTREHRIDQGLVPHIRAGAAIRAARNSEDREGSPIVRRRTANAGEAEEEELHCRANTKSSKSSPFGTKRHSAAMVALWRTQMPEADADAAWNACQKSGVMQDLGYTK